MVLVMIGERENVVRASLAFVGPNLAVTEWLSSMRRCCTVLVREVMAADDTVDPERDTGPSTADGPDGPTRLSRTPSGTKGAKAHPPRQRKREALMIRYHPSPFGPERALGPGRLAPNALPS